MQDHACARARAPRPSCTRRARPAGPAPAARVLEQALRTARRRQKTSAGLSLALSLCVAGHELRRPRAPQRRRRRTTSRQGRAERALAAMQRAGRQQAAPLPYHIPLEDVAVGERIGGGALGEVRVAVYDGNQVALKSLHMLRTDDAAQAEWGGALSPAERDHQLALLIRECDTLRGLDHRNILTFIGVVVDRDSEPLYLATQFIPGGTLHDLIHHARYAQLRDEAGCLPLPTQLAVAHDIFSGLSYLAGKHLIHRDIKPANILTVTENGQLVKILLADFGESKQLTMTMTRAAGTVAGTPLYMAPEMHEEDDAKGPKADVFPPEWCSSRWGAVDSPTPGRKYAGASWFRRRSGERRTCARFITRKSLSLRGVASWMTKVRGRPRQSSGDCAQRCELNLRTVTMATGPTTAELRLPSTSSCWMAIAWQCKPQQERPLRSSSDGSSRNLAINAWCLQDVG